MPITCQQTLKPLSREEFGRLSYDLMADVLAIRKELGRFFDEKHYKQALALRRQDVILEAPVCVSHQTFSKTYFLDALFAEGAIVEFKAAEALTRRHKAQLLHYQMLVDLEHGLLINVRPERVAKEFVNCPLRLTAFDSIDSQQRFAHHAGAMVNHTDLDALLWANLGRHEITFCCLKPEG